MSCRVLSTLVLLPLLVLGCFESRDVQISPAHAPRFPKRVLGYYAVPMTAFPRVAAAGFNVVHNYRFESHWEPDVDPFVDAAREYLDAAQQHGLLVLLGIPRNWMRQGQERAIRQAIQRLRSHPAILIWYEDEVGQDGDVEAVALLDRIVREEDPARGLAIEEGTDLPALRVRGTVRMFTYYPVDHRSRSRGRLRTVRQRFPVQHLNIPFIPVLQTFGRDLIEGYEKQDLEAPRWPELQFTLYSSLMAGAEGICLYTYLHSTRYDTELEKAGRWPYVEAGELPVVAPGMWESAQRCVQEAGLLFGLLEGAKAIAGIHIEEDVAGIDIAAWETSQGILILLSNATYVAQSVHLLGLSTQPTIHRLHHDRWGPAERVEGTRLRVTLPGPGGVCLLASGSSAAPRSTATPELESSNGTDHLRVGGAGL